MVPFRYVWVYSWQLSLEGLAFERVGLFAPKVRRDTGRCVKRARFGKLAFFLQNGAFFGPKIGDFRPFRTTF